MAQGNAYPAIQLDDRGEPVDSGVVVQFTDDTDQPGTGGGGGGQSGSGSPIGVVTPAAIGSVYTDTATGALYVAIGMTSADWVQFAGPSDATAVGTGTTGTTVVLNTVTASVSANTDGSVTAFPATQSFQLPQVKQLSPLFTITDGALPTLSPVSGTALQVSTTRDVDAYCPWTSDASANTATCLVELSPDNTTFSELTTESVASALNAIGAITGTAHVRVPAGWYLRLTVTHAALGTLTYA